MSQIPSPTLETRCTAFNGGRRIASGDLAAVVLAAKRVVDADDAAQVLVFEDATSRLIDVDFRGTDDNVLSRFQPPPPSEGAQARDAADGGDDPSDGSASPYREVPPPRGRGRPRLGVVAREVTLLPRHWEWLGTQPGGASAAVRRLVDEARKTHGDRDRRRHAQEAAYRFMLVLAGDEPGFEESTRALYANDARRFAELTAAWPPDVRDHARMLAARAFDADRPKTG